MSEPVIVLPDSAGRTFIESGLIAIRSSRDRLFEKRESRSSGSWMNSVAVHHEWIHFLQSITCAAVYTASQLILLKSRDVVQAAAKGNIPETLARLLRDAESSVYAVGNDERVRVQDFGHAVKIQPVPDAARLDMLDLMEGVAVLESFRMCSENAEATHFIDFLDREFPGEGNTVYRRAFEFLAEAIGLDGAFELLAPISFLALQEKHVPEAFVHHVRTLTGAGVGPLEFQGGRLKEGPGGKPLDPRELAEYPALLEALELDDTWTLPHAFKDGEPEAGHVCLDPCATVAVRSLGLDRVLQLAAVPHRVTAEEFHVLRAPLTVYSGDDRTIIEPNGQLDVETHRNVIYATSLTGAALRLIDREGEPPYQFCPQVGRCPHYENALCHRQFAPPRESRSHEQCGFPLLTKAETGLDPSQLWAAVDRGLKSREQLVEAFEEIGEARILELCRQERASLTKWLGADGYGDIEWKSEATANKVIRALQTQKMDHAMEARMFRDAVVKEVRERLLEASP